MAEIQIEVLSPDKAAAELREYGMKITADTIRCGIRQGVYPFGVCVTTGAGSPVYQIFRNLFDEWIKGHAVTPEAGEA